MSNPSDFCIGCMNDEYPEGLRNEIESLRQQLAEAEALRVCADHDANELARQLTEYQARDKVRIRYLELIANVNATDYEYKSWARAALDIRYTSREI